MRLPIHLVVGAAVAAAIAFINASGLSGQGGSVPALVVTAHNGGPATPYSVPRTPWGDPDLQGV